MAKVKKKKPVAVVSPLDKKQPRTSSDPPSFRGGVISWRFNAADRNGPFSWDALTDGAEFMSVIKTLSDIETMSEANQQQRGCHFIPLYKLSKEAQDRLAEIQLEDLDELYSIRLTGRGRVFCVHRPQYMRVLWFDPDHRVCPAKLKHT